MRNSYHDDDETKRIYDTSRKIWKAIGMTWSFAKNDDILTARESAIKKWNYFGSDFDTMTIASQILEEE